MKEIGRAVLFVVVLMGIIIIAATIKDKCSINMKRINVENYVFASEEPKLPCKYLYGDIVHEYNNVLRGMEGIKKMEKSEGEERWKRESCLYEFMKNIRFYETFYFDVHSKKFFTADNYEEILKGLKSVTEENREYFYDF